MRSVNDLDWCKSYSHYIIHVYPKPWMSAYHDIPCTSTWNRNICLWFDHHVLWFSSCTLVSLEAIPRINVHVPTFSMTTKHNTYNTWNIYREKIEPIKLYLHSIDIHFVQHLSTITGPIYFLEVDIINYVAKQFFFCNILFFPFFFKIVF